MLVKIIAEIVEDIHVYPDDVLNSDTVGDYKNELDCSVINGALSHLMSHIVGSPDITILAAEPTDEGIDEYNKLLNNWQPEYIKRIQNNERKRV